MAGRRETVLEMKGREGGVRRGSIVFPSNLVWL